MDLDFWDCFEGKQEMLLYVTNAPKAITFDLLMWSWP